MLTAVPFSILVGIVLGFLAGMGVGGGSLLILWLTLAINMDPAIARTVNLMFFITSAVSVSLFRWHQGSLNVKEVLPAILAGCICAAIVSIFSNQIDPSAIKRMFGILLLITGVRELLYRPRKDK